MPGYVVAAGYVTVETAVPGGRARVDIRQGARLPEDVAQEDLDRCVRLGQIKPDDPPEPPAGQDAPDLLAGLRAEAAELGVKVHPRVKAETLARKIAEARAGRST